MVSVSFPITWFRQPGAWARSRAGTRRKRSIVIFWILSASWSLSQVSVWMFESSFIIPMFTSIKPSFWTVRLPSFQFKLIIFIFHWTFLPNVTSFTASIALYWVTKRVIPICTIIYFYLPWLIQFTAFISPVSGFTAVIANIIFRRASTFIAIVISSWFVYTCVMWSASAATMPAVECALNYNAFAI